MWKDEEITKNIKTKLVCDIHLKLKNRRFL